MNDNTATKLLLLSEISASKNKAEHHLNNEIEQNIESVLKESRSLYWQVLDTSRNKEIDDNYLGVIEKAMEYLHCTSEAIVEHNQSINTKPVHINYHPEEKGGKLVRKLAAFLPLSFHDVQRSWNEFSEVHSFKLFFSVLGACLTLLLGEFNTLSWVFIGLTVAHFISRLWANNYRRETDQYIQFNRNIQIFIHPYFWLFVGNMLSQVISFDGLPEGTFMHCY